MGPTTEALALADFLIAKYSLRVDRYTLAYAIMEHEEAAMSAPAAAGAQGEVGPVDGCEDCAYNGRYLCDTHGSTPHPAAADGGVRERAREIITNTIGFEFGQSDLQEVGDHDMENLAGAIAEALSSHRQGGEPNSKLVGWWNGIMPDVTERSPYGPSVRWGAEAENSGHDIPLYDGYNPIHYNAPPLSKFRELAERWRTKKPGLSALGCANELIALVEKGAGNG